ncbi:integrase family protein [Calothrix sp. PCC 7716]|nr:integrase family protein [Calothrix sp. PCC 7716]BDA71687.1 integrase family protein [Calothrix sp. PCC 7716]BDA71877.1 integrase family protein [Calothrix sp. PCC 7716]BDA72507.1 integrase family protein [Calothrix sp. PCC 7716]BDA75178.1 integrase family protein [Calothrix sp. PCC 7716]
MLQQNKNNKNYNNEQELKCPKCGSSHLKKAGKSRDTGEQMYKCKSCQTNFNKNPKRISNSYISFDGLSVSEMFNLDIWNVTVFGLEPDIACSKRLLNFSDIELYWLKIAVKYWIQYRIGVGDATSTIFNRLYDLKYFYRFLKLKYGSLQESEINRDLVVNYLVYLREKIKSPSTRNGRLGCLKLFLENCARFDWANIYKEPLVYPEDFAKRIKSLPKFIPPDVIKQIDDNIMALPEPVALMVKVLRQTGIRLSELCYLNFDCIRQDSTGTWWLNIYQFKMKKQLAIPVARELASDIQKQQEYIRKELGKDFDYLFCLTKSYSWFEDYTYKRTSATTRKIPYRELQHFIPIPKRMRQKVLRGYLSQLANEKEIRGSSGEIYPIHRCHSFRHTHGTELINAGVPQHIVQKRLGHESPEMTMCYAHIHDETMKHEMNKFWDGRVVNIKGEIIISENPDLDTTEMQWIKKNMKAQTLADGFCALPITQNCPVQGSPCLACQHFRTTREHLETHKKHLESTVKLIENARDKQWERQVENNLPIVENLNNIIRGLSQKDVVYGHESYPKLGDETNG